MSKLTPSQKWDNIISSRLTALRTDEGFRSLCKSALNSLGRKRRHGSVEDWRVDFRNRAISSSYQEWLNGVCKPVADKFGIDEQVVSMLCLVKNFDPEKDFRPFVLEATPAKVYVVTKSADEQILRKLAYESFTRLGLPLIQETNSGEIRHTIKEALDPNSLPELPRDKKLSIRTLFRIRIELPSGFPPDMANAVTKYALSVDRLLRERLGYSLPKRLRTSKYAKHAEKYKVAKRKLDRGESYDIIDNLYGGEDALGKDMALDKKRRLKVNVTRHRLKKDLSKSDK
jgi:hypothetical protein